MNTSRILRNGNRLYLHGTNYPWMVVDGKSNYGLDFGVNVWGSHRGVSTRMSEVERDMRRMSEIGLNTLRWFVFTDGRGGIRYDEKSMPVAPSDKCVHDLRSAADLAATYDLQLIFVLLDFLLLFDINPHHRESKAGILATEDGREMLVENLFKPVFCELGNHPGILAWEIMNEPDWVIDELDPNRKEVSNPLPQSVFAGFVSSTADLIHEHTDALVTVGGGRIKFMHIWDDDAFGLDFLQVHTYNDFLNERHDDTLFGRPYNTLGLRRPLLIGEFATSARELRQLPNRSDHSISLQQYLDFVLREGYAGALYWSYNDVDKCRTEDPIALREWVSRKNLA